MLAPGPSATSPTEERPLAVLDVTEFYGETSGGVKTYLLQKARYADARPHLREVLVVPGDRNRTVDRPGGRSYQLRGPRVPGQRPYRLMLDGAAIRRIVARERPDLIEIGSHFLVPWLVARAARDTAIPLVWFCHSNLPGILAPDPERNGWARRCGWSLARRYMLRLGRLCAATLAASESIAGELERLGLDNVVRVSLGVDVDVFHPGRRARSAETRRRLGLPEGPLAVYAGRIAREKCLDVLLAAWPAVARTTGAHLALVGDGPARARLRGRCQDRTVHWLRYQTDRERLADLLASADLYLAPSPVETFGLAALEAMACDTRVLSADRGAVAEHVVRSEAGAVYATGSADSLAARAVELLQTPLPERSGGSAYARRFTWPEALDGIFGAYRRILDRR